MTKTNNQYSFGKETTKDYEVFNPPTTSPAALNSQSLKAITRNNQTTDITRQIVVET